MALDYVPIDEVRMTKSGSESYSEYSTPEQYSAKDLK